MWTMMQRQQLGGWVCLLAMGLHLLAPLGRGCPRFDVAEASYSTGHIVETSYDGMNRPEVIAEGGRVTQYGYDLGGRAVILAGKGQQETAGVDS